MLVKLGPFNGMMPRIEKRYLPDTAAQDALNCKFGRGGLRAWQDTSVVNTPTKAGTKKTIFLYENQYWFHWITDVNVVKSPVKGDAFARAYFTGDGAPKMTANDVAVQGGTDYPVASYLLGVPAPATVPTLVVSGTITDPDPTLVESRAYVYTYVSYYGEEGPPCAVSAIVSVAPGQTVTLSNLSTGPVGNYRITAKRIYRTNTGSTSTAYQFVAEIPVANVSYADLILSAALGEVLPSAGWLAPPSDLIGLISLPNGSFAGISGKKVCFSVPYQPHAWPLAYQVPFDETPVALGAYGISVHVTTTGTPYRINGSDPANLSPPEKIEEGTACVSKRGMVDFGDLIMYPATDGLVLAGNGVTENATAEIMQRSDWQVYTPSAVIGYAYAGLYVGFNATGGFIFSPSTKDFTRLDTVATAGFRDPKDGKLYLQVGNNIVQWDVTGSKSLAWKSKPFYANFPANMSCAQVFAPSYPVTVKVYADNVLKHTQSVADQKPFRLPAGYLAEAWEIETTGPVDMVYMATSMDEIRKAL